MEWLEGWLGTLLERDLPLLGYRLPAARLRVGVGRLAHEFLLQHGGSAYLAEPMVRADIAAERLYTVDDAPVIYRSAYAIHNVNNEKLEIVNKAIELAKASCT